MDGFLIILGPLVGIAVGVGLALFLGRGRAAEVDGIRAQEEAQERQAMRALIDANIDAIITDRPDLLKQL